MASNRHRRNAVAGRVERSARGRRAYDAIIVLGAGLEANGSPGQTTRRRVMHAVELFRQGRAEVLLLTGGRGGNGAREADAMRDLAVAAGIPGNRILLERLSRTTFENATYSARLMRERGWSTGLVVSDRLHLPRALFAFNSAGIRATGSAVPGSGFRSLRHGFGYAAHEILGLLWYAVLILIERLRR